MKSAKRSQLRSCAVLASAGFALSVSCVASAGPTGVTWDNAAGGSWGNAANWNPAVLPDNNLGGSFAVTIGALAGAYTVMLDIDRRVTTLNLDSADVTLDLAGSEMRVDGVFMQTAGALLSGAGILDVGGAAMIDNSVIDGLTELRAASSIMLTNASIENTTLVNAMGDITLQDGALRGVGDVMSQGDFIFNAAVMDEICDTCVTHTGAAMRWTGTGDIVMDGSMIMISATSEFRIETAGMQSITGVGVASTIINNGTFRKSVGGGDTTITGVRLDNTAGTVQVEVGALRADDVGLVAGALTGGTWNVFNGAELDFLGQAVTTNQATVTIRDAGSVFSDLENNISLNDVAGSLEIDTAGAFNTSGDFQNDGLLRLGTGTQFQVNSGNTLTNVAGGVLTGGVFEIAGELRFDGADITSIDADVTLDGVGASIVDSAGALDGLRNLSDVGPAGRLAVINGRNFTTIGNFTIDPTGNLTVGAGTVFEVDQNSILTNFATGVFSDGVITLLGELRFANADINTIANRLTLDGPGSLLTDNTGGGMQDGLRNLNLIDATGSLSVLNGRQLNLQNGLVVDGELIVDGSSGVNRGVAPATALTVTGDVVGGGALTLRDASLSIDGGMFQGSGAIELDGASLSATTAITLGPAASLRGSGVVMTPALDAGGTVEPGLGVGTLTIDGDVALRLSATVGIEIAGLLPAAHDQLIVSGAFDFESALAGTLDVSFVNGFAPSFGDFFDVILFSSWNGGEFETLRASGAGAGLGIEAVYLPDRVRIVVIPAPSGAAIFLMAAGIVARRRRSA